MAGEGGCRCPCPNFGELQVWRRSHEFPHVFEARGCLPTLNEEAPRGHVGGMGRKTVDGPSWREQQGQRGVPPSKQPSVVSLGIWAMGRSSIPHRGTYQKAPTGSDQSCVGDNNHHSRTACENGMWSVLHMTVRLANYADENPGYLETWTRHDNLDMRFAGCT
jgi:hypothetical protein